MKGPILEIENRYMTLAQAGAYFGGRSAEAMRMLARRGIIPVSKLGKRIFVDRRDLDKAMQAAKLEIPE